MTIYALSTGPGVSGVAIIRISGPESKETPGGPAIPLHGYSGSNTPYFKLF